MIKELARKLLFIVNDKSVMSQLDEYINHRIDVNRDNLEFYNDPNAKGALQELRRFKTLRDEVLKAAE